MCPPGRLRLRPGRSGDLGRSADEPAAARHRDFRSALDRPPLFLGREPRVRDPGQHEQLFDWDRALTVLLSREGERAEAVALMGSDHPLLRMWADG